MIPATTWYRKRRRSLWVLSGLIVCVGLLSRCVNGGGEEKTKEEKMREERTREEGTQGEGAQAVVNAKGAEYAGSEACMRCHASISDSYMHTAHYFSSRPAGKQWIKGSFLPGKNEFSFNDYSPLPADVKVVMEERDSGLYQVAYINGKARKAERFGIVIGSGRKAQTYLYWRDHQLLQLPVSYFTATESWANSPGFPYDQVKFNRLIPAHCLECHSTVCTLLPTTATIPGPNPPAFFDKGKMLLGIGCENCHGPGAKHVAFQSQHPADKKGMYIVNPARFTRQQSLDACAVCHSGIRDSRQPAFSFVAGDDLADYFAPGHAADTAHPEVHGNQYGLLAASKCFLMSKNLTCVTCHNTHVNERGNLALFSQRCMDCHQPSGDHFCTMRPSPGMTLTSNCIDCHMPVQASGLVNLMVPGQSKMTPLLLRSHLIAIYPGQIKKTMDRMRMNK